MSAPDSPSRRTIVRLLSALLGALTGLFSKSGRDAAPDIAPAVSTGPDEAVLAIHAGQSVEDLDVPDILPALGHTVDSGWFYYDDAAAFWQKSPTQPVGAQVEQEQVANTATETPIYTTTLDAGALAEEQVIIIRMAGAFRTANASDSFTLRVYVGGTEITAVDSVPKQVSDAPLQVEVRITIRTAGADGTLGTFTEAVFDGSHNDDATDPQVTIDTTVDNEIEATVQWDVADPGNSVEIEQCWTEV